MSTVVVALCPHQLRDRTGGESFWEAHTRHRAMTRICVPSKLLSHLRVDDEGNLHGLPHPEAPPKFDFENGTIISPSGVTTHHLPANDHTLSLWCVDDRCAVGGWRRWQSTPQCCVWAMRR